MTAPCHVREKKEGEISTHCILMRGTGYRIISTLCASAKTSFLSFRIESPGEVF